MGSGRYEMTLEFGAADRAQAERLAAAWAGTCAAEYGTVFRGVRPVPEPADPSPGEPSGGRPDEHRVVRVLVAPDPRTSGEYGGAEMVRLRSALAARYPGGPPLLGLSNTAGAISVLVVFDGQPEDRPGADGSRPQDRAAQVDDVLQAVGVHGKVTAGHWVIAP